VRLAAALAIVCTLTACTTTSQQELVPSVQHVFRGKPAAAVRPAVAAAFMASGYQITEDTALRLVLSDPDRVPANANDVLLTCSACPPSRWQVAVTIIEVAGETTVTARPQQIVNPQTPAQRVIDMQYRPTSAQRVRTIMQTAERSLAAPPRTARTSQDPMRSAVY
jgi:hypothetical protein